MIFLSHNQGFSWVTNNKILKIYWYLLRKYRLLIQGRNISMVHRDVNLENIIIKDNWEIFLIDWEASWYDYAEIDLVSFIYYAKLNERQINYFLKHYWFDFKKSSIDFLWFCYVYYVYCSIWYVLENNMVTKKYLYMERDIHILVQIIEWKLKLI
jgi:thiamine kinase-like enzyme